MCGEEAEGRRSEDGSEFDIVVARYSLPRFVTNIPAGANRGPPP